MVSNFEISELKCRFERLNCASGNEITYSGENFVVIVNRKQIKIAQILRTSANRYEIIKASEWACVRTNVSSFSEAAKVVNEFLSDN